MFGAERPRAYAHNMAHVYQTVVMLAPESPALRFNPQEIVSHGELNETANRFARKLLSEGVRRGDVVGILSHKNLGAYACMLACLPACLRVRQRTYTPTCLRPCAPVPLRASMHAHVPALRRWDVIVLAPS